MFFYRGSGSLDHFVNLEMVKSASIPRTPTDRPANHIETDSGALSNAAALAEGTEVYLQMVDGEEIVIHYKEVNDPFPAFCAALKEALENYR
jgi:hypothetical protein